MAEWVSTHVYVRESNFLSKNQVCAFNEMVLWIKKSKRNIISHHQKHTSDVKPLREIDQIEASAASYCLWNKSYKSSGLKEYKFIIIIWTMAEIPCGASGKETACPCRRCDVRDVGWIPGQGSPLEKGKATYSSVLSWRMPWAEEPAGLQSVGLQRVRHDWSDLTPTAEIQTMLQEAQTQVSAVLLFLRLRGDAVSVPLPPPRDTWVLDCLSSWKPSGISLSFCFCHRIPSSDSVFPVSLFHI